MLNVHLFDRQSECEFHRVLDECIGCEDEDSCPQVVGDWGKSYAEHCAGDYQMSIRGRHE